MQEEGRKAWPLTQVHRREQHRNTQGTHTNSLVCFEKHLKLKSRAHNSSKNALAMIVDEFQPNEFLVHGKVSEVG